MTNVSNWSRNNLPHLDGKVAIVTGGYTGIGFETVLGLLQAGAEVIIAGRDSTKGSEAVEKLRQENRNNGVVSFAELDLSSLTSISSFSRLINKRERALDILVNNAGIFSPRQRETTHDGFELVFGTNHLGHFALTGQLLPSLVKSNSPRVITVTSESAKMGRIDFDDLQSEYKSYNRYKLYAQSKLANQIFNQELQRRSDKHGWGITSVAVHPGQVRTGMITFQNNDALIFRIFEMWIKLTGRHPRDGALSSILAVTCPSILAGGYYAPRYMEIFGSNCKQNPPSRALCEATAQRLWAVSENLTNVRWNIHSSDSL